MCDNAGDPEMSTSTGSRAPSASSSAPPNSVRKRRLACDNCHLSKVRCTGETSGCQRCERGNKTCHYSESNMGRTPVQGANMRRKSSAHISLGSFLTTPAGGCEQQQPQQQHDWNSPITAVGSGVVEQPTRQPNEQLPSSSSAESDPPPNDRSRPGHDAMSIWDELNGHQQQHSSTSLLLDSIGNELQSPGFDSLVPDLDDIDFSFIEDGQFRLAGTPLDLDFSSLIRDQPPGASLPHHQQEQHLQQLHTAQDFANGSTTTSRYPDHGTRQTTSRPHSSQRDINYWATQLEELSCRPHQSHIPLDEVLYHSSQLLPRVTEAIRSLPSADTSSSGTLLLLILICLTQIITLFEQCIPSVISGVPSAGASSDLSLRLGAFQVDREVQQALQMHVVGRELSTVVRVCKLIKQILLQPDWNGASKRTHSLLLEDLQARTRTLVYQMKQKWSSAKGFAL